MGKGEFCLNPCFNGRYSLRRNNGDVIIYKECVLILVLMEDTHWDTLSSNSGQPLGVLILVLMEDTHWAVCFPLRKRKSSLNPCFNGRYSLSTSAAQLYKLTEVLILVLMEDTHWVFVALGLGFAFAVLILVLMEDTHWDENLYTYTIMRSLNPCFNGRYSLSV